MTDHDVADLTVSDADAKRVGIGRNAGLATLGGVSHVRGGDRAATVGHDNLVGQLCQYALAVYMTGGEAAYVEARAAANADPWRGDGGMDIPCCNIDVKGSWMRASPDPLRYTLAVRPRERHPDWVYVLALAAPHRDGHLVSLVGWATTKMLPAVPAARGVFAGAYVLPAAALRPMRLIAGRLANWRDRCSD